MPRQLAQNEPQAAFALSWIGANLFGPQSPWSSLLGQRERLQHELRRGRKYLDQLRKDLAACGALLQTWPTEEAGSGNGWMPSPSQQAAAKDVMEEFLLKWLARLEERLDAVNLEIENLETRSGAEPLNPEEAMYELLRAAG